MELSFISKQSIFPEQKAQMLHFDKVESQPLFLPKIPLSLFILSY